MVSLFSSYWKVFRIIFVVFFLYLMGDAFYRWDGFRYYASFSEFLPSVGLAMIIWSTVALFTSVIIWIPLIWITWISRKVNLKIKIEHELIFFAIFMLLNCIVLTEKMLKVRYLSRFIYWDFGSLIIMLVIAICLAWICRNKAESWMNSIHERITPLVWIFGITIALSVPLVIFETWIEGKKVVQRESSTVTELDSNRPNILLVTFDALTARDMSVYGFHRETTPFITEWAKAASLFTKVEAESNITTPTTASLMTGKRLWTHQTYHIAGSSKPVKSEIENLPLLLKKNGYYNIANIVNPFASVRKLGIAGSFDIAPIETGFSKQANLLGMIDGFLYQFFGNKIQLYNWLVQRDFVLFKVINKLSKNVLKTTAPPEKAFNKLLSVLDSSHSRPFFSWIHLYPPHDPYLPTNQFMGMYDSSLNLRTYKSQDHAVKRAARYHLQYEQFPPEVKPDVDTLRARYDEFIRYCDHEFEKFISQLAERDILKNTIIILSSDHGESFEHNYIKHSFNNLYEQITHIPLIIKEPGQIEGRIIDNLTEQIDIPATIIDLAGIPIPSWMEGRSLVPLMRGRLLSPRPAFAMALEGQASRGNRITNGRIAVWDGDYKLIHYLDDNESLLFNLKQDPSELNNLMEKESNAGQRLLDLIHANLSKANERIINQE